MKTGIIYVLIDPLVRKCRYIGKTIKSAQTRLNQHIADAKIGRKSHKNNWIRKLLKTGNIPEIKIIACDLESRLSELEKSYIKEFRQEGHPLTNGTDGGEGISGWHHSEETRQKLSQAAQNRLPISQETREKKRQSMLGKKHSSESRERHRLAALGKNNHMYGKTAEQNPMYGKRHSEESKRKMSEAIKKSHLRRKNSS